MHVYTHVHMRVCMCICRYRCMHTYVWVYIYIYILVYVHVLSCFYRFTMYACLLICLINLIILMYCICVCVSPHTYIETKTYFLGLSNTSLMSIHAYIYTHAYFVARDCFLCIENTCVVGACACVLVVALWLHAACVHATTYTEN